MIVAIDGPAGAGKSTVARAVARRLGVGHLDTGAMYRALTWLALERGVDPGAADELSALAHANPAVLEPEAEGGRVWIADADATEAIRHPEVTARVSEVAAHAGVREAMVAAQRSLMRAGDWVCEGRDIGTAVCPTAEIKVFLTASDEERARRRRDELAVQGVELTHDEVLADVRRRDELDSTRAVSPLRVAQGAVVIDSSALTADEVVELIAGLAAATRPAGSR
ncbi:MAG: CMP/dCMP kinase [Miltoncostaeaceae bacterium]|nr:CMP/dCMP kinase [Miltoncostaeaceae bacterium]